MITLALFSLVEIEVVPGRIQQPITYFKGPWDDFMGYGVNNPSTSVIVVLRGIHNRIKQSSIL